VLVESEGTIAGIRRCVSGIRAEGGAVGLVPTMGALHEGHLSLVRAARQRGDEVVVSIFVNPAQFGPGEDFERYPRSLEADLELCRRNDVFAIFTPDVREMYPVASLTRIHVAGLTEGLCGAHRPGHFDGVALVVGKLFNIVQPDRAYFGQKDAQQAAVVKRMVADLNWPIEIVVCPTVREADGLAMSSRNRYLSPQEREQAAVIYRALLRARQMFAAGEREAQAITAAVAQIIRDSGPWTIDYVAAVDPDSMRPMTQVSSPALVAAAVRIGHTRLIDNLIL